MSERGRFIILEGADGVGKSTMAREIASYLNERGIRTLLTREPGGTQSAEAIRKVLMSTYDDPLHPTTELLLMFASRYQHIENLIEPHLAQGTWVICDRFTLSSYAYQVVASGVSEEVYATLMNEIIGDSVPDVTYVLTLPAEAAAARLAGRSHESNRLDELSRLKHDIIEKAMCLIAERDESMHVIPSDGGVIHMLNKMIPLLPAGDHTLEPV